MSEVLKGKTIQEAKDIIADYYNLIKGEEVKDEVVSEVAETPLEKMDEEFNKGIKEKSISWCAMGAILEGQTGEQDVEE